jgi:hydrogenase maturation protein HypF
MVENNLNNEKVIGVAFDGTGFGSNNNLWGAEFLIGNYRGFKRAAHLKEIPLLGGERAILEPARIAAVWLYLIYKDKLFNLGFNWIKKMHKEKWQVLKSMYLSGFNSPLASSMGRLFDAVGSLVLGKSKVNFEAELAMELEKIATSYKWQATSYKFKVIKQKDGYILNPLLIFKEIMGDLKAKEPKEKIAYRFHLTIAQMVRKMCLVLRKENKINKVVLSGGVFQNNLLLCLALDLLYKEDFKVFTHKELSCNDSGISLGQVAVAN